MYINKIICGGFLLSISTFNSFNAQNSISTQNLSGQNINNISTAVPFLLINPDARINAMGGAGCAISSDANALYWNPARLALTELDDLGINFTRFGWLRALVDDISYLNMIT